jgi:hypothetical protein
MAASYVWAVAVLALAGGTLADAHAGRQCEAGRPTVANVEKSLALAQRTHEALEAAHAKEGVQLVILARAGQDLSKYRLRYSHLGFAYRGRDAQGQPAWRVLHKLNVCGTAQASVYRQGLGEFFLDDLWRYETAWVVPRPEVQTPLLALAADNRAALRLHHPPYSVASYAWGVKYQQSNQWALETVALALDPAVSTRGQAQAWLRQSGYQPSTLRVGPLSRLGGRVGSANVFFDDHPMDKRYSDRIETVTVDSVFAWMEQARLGGSPIRLP